jgi:hypothetical protein
MPEIPATDPDDSLRRRSRRLQWSLLLYLLVLLAIGIGVVRLASTARRFSDTTVALPPVPAESLAGVGPAADETILPVSGVTP